MTKKQTISYIFLALSLSFLCVSLFGSFFYKSIMDYFATDYFGFIFNKTDLIGNIRWFYFHRAYSRSLFSPLISNFQYSITQVIFYENIVLLVKNVFVLSSAICLVISNVCKSQKNSKTTPILITIIIISCIKIFLYILELLCLIIPGLICLIWFENFRIISLYSVNIYHLISLINVILTIVVMALGLVCAYIYIINGSLRKVLKIVLLILITITFFFVLNIYILNIVETILNVLCSFDMLVAKGQYFIYFGYFKDLWKYMYKYIPCEYLFGRFYYHINFNNRPFIYHFVHAIYVLPDLFRFLLCLLCIISIMYIVYKTIKNKSNKTVFYMIPLSLSIIIPVLCIGSNIFICFIRFVVAIIFKCSL